MTTRAKSPVPTVVYLGGPITGLSFREAQRRRAWVSRELARAGIITLSPLRGKSYLQNEKSCKAAGYTQPLSQDRAIFDRDRGDVVDRANVLLMDLSGAKAISIGSVFELCWATEYRKFTVTVMEPGNIHDHAFVRVASTVIVPTLKDAIQVIKRWTGREDD